jgi:hypothetical protein
MLEPRDGFATFKFPLIPVGAQILMKAQVALLASCSAQKQQYNDYYHTATEKLEGHPAFCCEVAFTRQPL